MAFNLYMFFGIYMFPEFKWVSLIYQLKMYFGIGFLFFTIGFLLSVFFALIIGWPFYWLAKKYSVVNYITCSFCGGAVTVIPLILCYFFEWNLPSATSVAGVMLLVAILSCGMLSGMTFYFLDKKGVELKNNNII